jgi:glycosyltransferase 2 family protein
LKFLTDVRSSGPFLALTVGGLLIHVVALQLMAHSVGLRELDFAQCLVLLGVLGLSYALPNAPGFFGTVQLSLYAGLAVYVSPEKVTHEGAALVFAFYALYLGSVVVVTLAGLIGEYALPAAESAVPGASRSSATVEEIEHSPVVRQESDFEGHHSGRR